MNNSLIRKCLVKGCDNSSDEGFFVGDLCGPCHHCITTGAVSPTNSFLNQITALKEENTKLKDFIIKKVLTNGYN